MHVDRSSCSRKYCNKYRQNLVFGLASILALGVFPLNGMQQAEAAKKIVPRLLLLKEKMMKKTFYKNLTWGR